MSMALEGDMEADSHYLNGMTLDEPVSATILRDLKNIGQKLKVVLLPNISEEAALSQLKNWDLWGPLLICLALSIIMAASAPDEQATSAFSSVFVIVWAGSAILTLNAQLLGGKISFFQSVCILGYCIFPLVVAAILCSLWKNAIFKTILVAGGFGWALRASIIFMASMVKPERKVLATYPVCLFYIVISWMIYISC